MAEEFSIAELIGGLTEGLHDAHDRANAAGREPVVELTDCEIELSVSATYEGGGGVKFWILNASGGASTGSVSKIRMKFQPIKGATATQFHQRVGDGPEPPTRQEE